MDVHAHWSLVAISVTQRIGDGAASALGLLRVEAEERALNAKHGDLLAQPLECARLPLLHALPQVFVFVHSFSASVCLPWQAPPRPLRQLYPAFVGRA